jgi:hypothetical protein
MRGADRILARDLRASLSPLEPFLKGNIITLRCEDTRWRFEFVTDLIVRNHEPGRKILYLHWVDYHKRFWTLDYDHIFRAARKCGCDPKDISNDVYFVRAFSRDNNEVEENWRRIFAFGRFDMIILDSVDELYEESRRDAGNRGLETGIREQGTGLPMTYSIGKFAQLCIKNDASGIILDGSRNIHPYLGHISSIIIELSVDRTEVVARLLKHPSLPDESLILPRNNQYTLRRWL